MKRKIKITTLVVLLGALAFVWQEYREFSAVPKTRLAAGQYYPEMPPDEHHDQRQLNR